MSCLFRSSSQRISAGLSDTPSVRLTSDFCSPSFLHIIHAIPMCTHSITFRPNHSSQWQHSTLSSSKSTPTRALRGNSSPSFLVSATQQVTRSSSESTSECVDSAMISSGDYQLARRTDGVLSSHCTFSIIPVCRFGGQPYANDFLKYVSPQPKCVSQLDIQC